MSPEAPFARYTDEVRPEWIDYSGHMNMGFYLPAFELAAVCFFSVVDISEGYRMRSGNALFVAETHINYERELRAGVGLRFESQILDASDKAIDCMHFMYAADEGYLAAVNQILHFFMSISSGAAPRPSPTTPRPASTPGARPTRASPARPRRGARSGCARVTGVKKTPWLVFGLAPPESGYDPGC